jgi:luciferase family oxidoreductase group 1
MIPFSVLDLSPIVEGGTVADALQNSLDLARHAERLGYKRFWLAAEQFGTLASLFPGRIDLGLGRAPGTDPLTAHALRRGARNSADTFASDVQELQAYFQASADGKPVQAVPGAGLDVPLWLLGSSLYGAQLAAALGLPYAFASHFAPDLLMTALETYRREFVPSEKLPRPYAMAAVGIVAADSDAEARRLATSLQQSFLNLRRGRPGKLPPPVERMDELWAPAEQALVESAFREGIVGGPETVRAGIEAFLHRTEVDELMVTASVYDHEARKRSFEIVAHARAAIADEPLAAHERVLHSEDV